MDKVMLITGATSGIGTFLSHYYSHKGYTLFLHGRSDEKLTTLQSELNNPKATYLKADFTSMDEIAAMFEQVKVKTQALDVLVNNAFGKLECPLDEAEPAAISEFFQVSLAGTVEIIRQSIPLLKGSPSPHIINIVA